MAKSNEIDMLHGPLLMKILVFSLPLAASSVLQQLFNSIDVAVVGHFASSQALAAVGSNGPVISLLINLFLGVSMGANVIISNHIGQNDEEGIQKAVSTAFTTAIVSGLILMCLGVAAAKPILTIMGTPDDVLTLAATYLRIYFLGIPFFLIFNFGAAILRSMGDTKRPLYILVIAGIVNTVLNLFFVIVLKMSVAGVAVATGIANLVSALLIIRLLCKEKAPFRLHLNKIGVVWSELKRMLMIGIPAGLQGMVFSFSNVLLQTAINGYGSDAIAGSAAALNFEYYCYFVIAAFNGAAISFIGQNYGAGNKERVKRIYWICLTLSVVCCGALNKLFVWQHSFFLSFFSNDPNVQAYGATRMDIVLAWQFIASSYEISASSLRGMGKSMLPTILTVFGTCLLRIVWVYAVCPVWHTFDVIMLVYPVSWCLTGIMVCTAYYITARKKLRTTPIATCQ
ncbi:MATE family efflux transporter [uncultured Prevotella sp.]|uniref:MATE family efflux transporter n=1 Tax=uncultured Prevotella sp. TaxID=159272 RepID=UPI0027E3767E|nr:MATE family efflux transporter [uncultured Prevotella sp.]